MATTIGTNRPAHSKTRTGRGRKRRTPRQELSRPGGELGARVKQVGGERFVLVSVDPAKRRSEWMMADDFGNVLIAPESWTINRNAAAARANWANCSPPCWPGCASAERTAYNPIPGDWSLTDVVER